MLIGFQKALQLTVGELTLTSVASGVDSLCFYCPNDMCAYALKPQRVTYTLQMNPFSLIALKSLLESPYALLIFSVLFSAFEKGEELRNYRLVDYEEKE